jgi:hypothetical protein
VEVDQLQLVPLVQPWWPQRRLIDDAEHPLIEQCDVVQVLELEQLQLDVAVGWRAR